MKPNLRLLPTEVWVDILCFPWIESPPPESSKLPDKRSKVGRLVDKIGNAKFAEFLQFYLHEWGKQTLGWLEFDKKGLFVKANPCSYPDPNPYLEIAQTEMPENIKCFKEIKIWHFDSRTLGFLRLIQPLLTNVNLYVLFFLGLGPLSKNSKDLRTILAHLSPLLDAGVHSIWSLENPLQFPWVRELFTGNLRLDQCKVLSLNNLGWGCGAKASSEMAQPEAELAISLDATINFCREWLTAERDCTEPRLFATHINPKVFKQISAAIRQDFLSAKTPCTFALKLEAEWFSEQYHEMHEFHLKNRLGEQLHGRRVQQKQSKSACFQISRHQANAGQQLEEWVKETERKQHGERRIKLSDTSIGQIDATGGGEVDDGGGEGKAADQPSTSKQD